MLPVLIVLVGVWLRAPAIWAPTPLEVDEALYASFARQISHENNPLLAGLAVDKPPLTFYSIALSFKLFTEPSEWAARLPDFFASITSLALMWRLALILYRRRLTATLATALLALSPLDITHAATIFTDPQVTLWTLGAMLAAIRGRGLLAAMLLGLAFASKQSALLALPLVMGIGVVSGRFTRRQALQFGAALLVMLVLPFAWDLLRETDGTGWWTLGAANNAPGRLIRSDEVLPRLATWSRALTAAAGSPLNGLLLILAVAAWPLTRPTGDHQRRIATDLVLAIYLVGYVLLHLLVAFNTYPRYAHPLAPISGLLIARGITLICQAPHQRLLRGLGALVLIAALASAAVSALEARRGDSWLDAQRRAHNGIVETVAYLNALPPGTIVYGRWTGWLLGWYTAQSRPAGMWLRTVYYPTPESLVAGARDQRDPMPRYFVVPASAPAAPWLAALQAAGFEPTRSAIMGSYHLYRLLPPQQAG